MQTEPPECTGLDVDDEPAAPSAIGPGTAGEIHTDFAVAEGHPVDAAVTQSSAHRSHGPPAPRNVLVSRDGHPVRAQWVHGCHDAPSHPASGGPSVSGRVDVARSQFSEAVWWCLTGGSAATEYVPRLLFIRRPPRPAVAAGFPTQARYRRDTTGSRRPTATARPATRLRVARRVLSTRPVLVAPCRDPAAAPSPDRAHVRRPRSPPLPTRGSSSTC